MNSEGTEAQRGEIITHLKILNASVVRQMSVWHVLRNGVIYGFGFVIGSTILTAFVASIVITFFNDTVFGDVIRWIVRSRG